MIIFASLADISWIYAEGGQDYHQYTRPDQFVSQFNFFDNVPAGNPIQVGEFAVVQNNTGNVTDGAVWTDPLK